jgi:hypothetical protein
VNQPIATVKKDFGDKAKLVAELEKFTKDEDLWVARTNKAKGLDHVSNAKLLRLHRTFTAVKEKFGTRAKLIDAIAEIEKRAKDEGYKTRLGAFPVPRLWDMYKSAAKRAGVATGEPKPARVAKAPKAAAARETSETSGTSGASGTKKPTAKAALPKGAKAAKAAKKPAAKKAPSKKA